MVVSCADAYQNHCCVESVILSLLFNPELEVPDIAKLKQFKERERAARANPFTAGTFDVEKLKEKERKKAENIEPDWRPTLATVTFSGTHESSAVSIAILGGQGAASSPSRWCNGWQSSGS